MKRKTRSIYTACLLAFLSGGVTGDVTAAETKTSQTARNVITGQIVDQTDGLPLPGVSVSIKGSSLGAITDQSGYFRIGNISATSVVVAVSCLGYTSAEYPLSLEEGLPRRLDIQLKPGFIMGREMVVIGEQFKGQAKALNQQKNNDNVTNVIAADQIGKFPDSNTGDALKRIPGITVFNDQGEARFALIRGTQPRFNSVMVNGERIPSAEADTRSIQLDLIPADMIQTIEVSKTLTPDMDADAIGGAVNLITKVPAGKRISLTVAGGANLIDETGGGRYQFAGTYADRFLEGKLGMIISGSYYDNNFGSDDLEAEWKKTGDETLLDKLDIRTYKIRRLRKSLSTGFDYRFNENHVITFNAIGNWRQDWENRYSSKITKLSSGKATITQQDKAGVDRNARLEDQNMTAFNLGGDHNFGKLSIDWHAAYAKASEDRPNERYISAYTKTKNFTTDISNPRKPFVNFTDTTVRNGISDSGVWEFNELTEEHQYTEDIDRNFALNLKYDLSDALKLKFGGRIRDKHKMRDNDFYAYTPVDEDAFMAKVYNNLANLDKPHYLPGSKYQPGNFISSSFVGSLDLDDPTKFNKKQALEEMAANFSAKEQINAAYAMATWDATDKLRLIGGLRLEHTRNEYDAFVYDADDDTLIPVSGEPKEYSNLQPHLHLRYKLNDQTNIRLAYTHSLARPNYFDLAPYRQVLSGDEEIYIGNPSLKPTLSKNVDFMVERYLGTVGVLSAGIFHKDVSDFIVTKRTVDDDTGFDLFQPVNGGDGSINGVELAAQFNVPYVKGLGLYMNYTYTHSKITNFNIEGRENDDLPLPGSPKHCFNASLSYETGPFSVRLSGNYHSDFIDSEEGSIGEESWKDRYYDSAFTLDLNGTYRLSKQLQLFFEITNLTNQPMRFYQGSKEYVAQEEWYDRKFLVGLKADL